MTVTINGTTGIAGTNGSASTPAVQGEDTNTGIFFPAADTVAVATNGVEQVRVDSSGNLLLGATSPRGSVKVTIDGTNDATSTISLYRSDLASRLILGTNYVGTFSNEALIFYTNSAERMRITTAGLITSTPTYNNTSGGAANVGVSAGGELYRSTSSLRYKNSVQDASHGLAELMTLRPVTYKGNNDGDTVFGGLIAEEVHEAGLTEFVQYAEDGSPDALAYGNMVSLCIKAIQELKSEVDSLKAQLEAK